MNYIPASPELVARARAQLMRDPKVEAEYKKFHAVIRKLTTHAFHGLLVAVGEEVDRRDKVRPMPGLGWDQLED